MMSLMNTDFHKNLSNYFESMPLYLDKPTQKKPNTRKLVEQPWQQTKGELWDEVTETLCNLDFIQAKAVAEMTYQLVNDFNAALEVIPDNLKNIDTERARQARIDSYTKDLILYSKSEIKALEIPESITSWSEDRIEDEIKRIKQDLNNADKLKDFSYFLGNKAGIFQKYSIESRYLTYQEAWNYANDGPVGKSAEKLSLEIRTSLLLHDQNSRPPWNPLPRALKILFPITKKDKQAVQLVAITLDGKQAIVYYYDNDCIHWNLSTGESIKTLTGIGSISSLSITPDGYLAFLVSSDKSCIIWNLRTGKVLETYDLKRYSGSINVVSFNLDGKSVMAISIDKTCILWDMKSESELKILDEHLASAKSVSITPDGKRAISVSDDALDNLILWNLEDGKKLLSLNTFPFSIQKLYITHDGSKAICYGYNCLIYFDLVTGEMHQTIKGLNVFFGSETSFTPDGTRALSVSKDNTTCTLWDLTSCKELLILRGHKSFVTSVSITPDGKFGITGSSDKTCILWDLEKGITLPRNNDLELQLEIISITPDGELAFIGSNDPQNDATCTLWNLRKGIKQYAIFENAERRTRIPGFKVHHYRVYAVAINPNGQRGISATMNMTFSGNGDNFLNIFDLSKGLAINKLSGHAKSILDVCITEDGFRAISSSEDETCILWDIVTGEKLKTFKGHEFNVNPIYRGHGRAVDKICLVPDGKLVIFSTSGAGSKLWNLEMGKVLPDVIPPLGRAFTITPDGKSVLSIAKDMSCIVWSLKTGKVSKILKGHSSSINTVSISPDGKTAISGSSNGTCIIWDLENGKLLSSYFSTSSFLAVRFLPQGIFLCGDFGEMVKLRPDRKLYCSGIAISTIKQIWDFELKRFTEPMVYCPLCGLRFEPPKIIIKTIIDILNENNIQPDQSPCLELPDEAWEHPGLLGECPACHESLKFNPFFGSNQKGIEDYLLELEKDREWETVFEHAEKAFKEQKWDEAFKLYLKLISAEKFDASYMRFNMAICRINGLTTINQEIIVNINLLISLLEEKHQDEKAQIITEKLKERLDLIKEAGKPWWKKLF